MNTTYVLVLIAWCAWACFAHNGIPDGEYSFFVTKNTTTWNAGQPIRLYISVFDDTGRFVESSTLAIDHDKYMHVLIFPRSFDTFWHLHPQDFGSLEVMSRNQAYFVDVVFPHAGPYLLGVDFVVRLQNGSLSAAHQMIQLNVTGTPAEPNEVDAGQQIIEQSVRGIPLGDGDYFTDAIRYEDVFGSQEQSSFRVELIINDGKGVQVGECANLHFVFYKKDGSKATNALAPYLNAPLHLALIGEKFDYINHVHGMDMDMGTSGCTANMNHSVPFLFGPDAYANFIFPYEGKWRLFAQTKSYNPRPNGEMLPVFFSVELPIMSSAFAAQPTIVMLCVAALVMFCMY